jgi:hypothetical protein
MVDNPILRIVGRGGEASVANAVGRGRRVLVEDRIRVLAPVTGVHWVIANQLELRKTVVAVVRTSGAVNDKGLVGLGVGKLLWTLVRGKAIVARPPVWRLLPRILWYGNDLPLGEGRRDSPRILHLGDAKIGWPAVILAIPTAINVVYQPLVLEVSTINCELVVRVELGLVLPSGLPWVGALTLHNKHAVVDSGAVVLTPHLNFRRRRVAARVRGEDDIPGPVSHALAVLVWRRASCRRDCGLRAPIGQSSS